MVSKHVGARHIKSLNVRCNNCSNSCEWTGELKELEIHIQSCDYVLLPCSNKCKTNGQIVKVLRKDLPDHLINKCPRRQYQCPHCEERGEYIERATSHLKTCPKVKVLCPNDECEVSIPRSELSTHRSTCDYEPVSCKYAEVGCEDRPLRKDLKIHEEDAQLHLQKTIECVLKHQKQIAVLTNKCTPFTFKVTKFRQKRGKCETIHSPPFYTSPDGYKMCVRVDANGVGDGKGTHVSVFPSLMKGDNDDSLTWPFTGTAAFELLNQLEDKNHHKKTTIFLDDEYSTRVVNGEKRDGRGYTKFISHNDIDFQSDKNCQYLKNDTLVIRVDVQVPDYKPWLECSTHPY